MGKIGLPLAVQFASKGHNVIGTDVNKITVDKINSKIEPFPGEAYLQKKLEKVIDSGKFIATTDTTAAVSKSEAVVVVVPLFVNEFGTPDFNWMDAATVSIGKGLNRGTLVSFETTLPVGTTRTRLAKILEKESGLIAGVDFYLAFSPERVFTGRVFEDLRKYPKLVGGINEISGIKAKNFYEEVLDFDERDDLSRANGVWDLGTSEASELAKLAETTYRDVNIALANQFAMFAYQEGIDILEVIEACNSQKFSHIHQPGIAVGGHCIPVYPMMYLENDSKAAIVATARKINKNMPIYAINVLTEEHGDLTNENVLILGISYRGGVKETAFSGAFDLIAELKKRGAKPLVQDPMYTSTELTALGLEPYELNCDISSAIVHTDHQFFKNLTIKDIPGIRTIFDGRNILKKENFPGVNLIQLGRRQKN